VSKEESVIVKETAGPVLWVRMNRPKVLNAIDTEMGTALLDAMKNANYDNGVRAVVLTGTGRAFTVGEDLNANKAAYERESGVDLEETLRNKYNPLIRTIRSMEKPVIAAVNGVTAGAGLGIALACDLRACSESATFHMAFSRVGLVPDSGTSFWLVKSLGLSRATELCLLGEPISSKAALELGLVSWVHPDDALQMEVGRLAQRLAEGPTKAYALAKRALNRALSSDIDGILDYEAYLQGIAGRTRDHAEGVRAFFEKREPKFSGV
jgi:2-(1,2-epoxy-1,2-dihydrophenyl)acetyl-CoA isomerase